MDMRTARVAVVAMLPQVCGSPRVAEILQLASLAMVVLVGTFQA